MTAIQMWFWTAQIRENLKKWSRMASKGGTQNPAKITENQFWSHLSASLHPMVTKIMKKWCHKTQNAWKMVPQALKKSINLWNKINEICLKIYLQLLNFPMISILPICIFQSIELQIVRQLIAGGAGGRGEALGIWIVRSNISRIGLIMDCTIQYFQDRTDYGSYDPLFPG